MSSYQLPEGHKLTEIGVIPEDWDVTQIGDLKPFVTSGSRGWAVYYANQGSLFIRITNLSRKSIYLDLEESKFVKLPLKASEGTRTQLKQSDVLISITADIGIIGYVDSNIPEPAYINQHIALIRFNTPKINSKFVSYFLASEKPQKLFRASTDTGAKAGMSLLTVQKIQFALPPESEQRSIATALSDIDELLQALDQLITKKRDLKQSAMQQLLTGKTRLLEVGEGKGYKQTEIGLIPEDWDVRPLSFFIKTLDAGVSVNSSDTTCSYSECEASILKTSCVLRGKFLPEESKKIIPQDLARARFNPKKDSIIISRMNTPALVGECGYVDDDYPQLFLPDRLWMTKPEENKYSCTKWLADILSFQPFSLAIKESATGTSNSMKNISKNSLLSIKIPFISKEEQTAIASILSDMDTEIATLEQRRHKTQELKQAMMQELLTGRIRLL